jgi:predicted nucleotide-binding protein
MEITKNYEATRFPLDTIYEAIRRYEARTRKESPANSVSNTVVVRVTEGARFLSLGLFMGNTQYKYDSLDEFLVNFHKARGYSIFYADSEREHLTIDSDGYDTRLEVSLPSRAEVEAIIGIFDAHEEASKIEMGNAVPVVMASDEDNHTAIDSVLNFRVFIGHGNNSAWRELKDHLQDLHGVEVEAFEIGARAGLAITEVLEQMLRRSSMALLVMTAEDVDGRGLTHARENVIHELGLFQGRLGFDRAIIMLEDRCQDFSNIRGIVQIRFPSGAISTKFGEVVATINRERQKGASAAS